MMFDIPRGVVFPVDRVDVRLVPGEHPLLAGNGAAIRDNWKRELAEKPALFNGRVAMLSEIVYRDRALVGRAHEMDYAAFLFWRRHRPPATAEHIYAHAMPVSSDGALVAVRMGEGTLGAGLVYFAAGSFEPEDFVDGQVDVPGNMAREVLEETGLVLAGLPADPGYHALSLATGTVLFRRYFLDRSADAIAADITRFMQDGGDPHGEIAGPVVIRNADDRPERLAAQMPALIDWHFSIASLVP